jgi:hypothetical protein
VEEKRKKKKGDEMRANKQVKCEGDAAGIHLVRHVGETRDTRFPASVLFASGVCRPSIRGPLSGLIAPHLTPLP